jgi:hypothetical protein
MGIKMADLVILIINNLPQAAGFLCYGWLKRAS